MRHFNLLAALVGATLLFPLTFYGNQPKVIVNSHGRMVNTKTGDEVRYYGTNYTLPFAHGYRATGALDVDRKEAINRDVYHMSRMGINAFRMHLWDAELADSIGNLLENEHLDLLDYLIAQLERRGIDIILTAQTNFGNGYPERNIDTGSFTYDFDKCKIHEDPAAIKAQERYIAQLVRHINPYTGKSYSTDVDIIAMEINNEPCHTSSPQQVKQYINTMVKAMKKAGWKKPILYNVSHNGDMVSGYYNSNIDGTTYQWYPIGLVAGYQRKGNFLPYVADYHIPFAYQKNFGKMARVVYEFDPADMLDSYLFPAVARTFARNGFQWATQFAYDPLDLARFNTEYQTHYLNLAYTPQKALGMTIARRVMEDTENLNLPKAYNIHKDSTDGYLTLSYKNNLALYNSPTEYIYTNSTSISPVCSDSLQLIAGYGSSPIIKYQGRGAYMLDKIPGSEAWRLEVLPDVLYSADPFAKPSLRREVAHIIDAEHPISIKLAGLPADFHVEMIAPNRSSTFQASNNTFTVAPGVYILAASANVINNVNPEMRIGNIRVNEYVAPQSTTVPTHLNHIPVEAIAVGDSLVVVAEAFAKEMPDSLILYPDDVSFWRDHNTLYTMHRISPYFYSATIPASKLKNRSKFSYRIVVPGKLNSTISETLATSSDITFPGAIEGNPLDWDSAEGAFYTVPIIDKEDPILLFTANRGIDGMEVSTIPDTWGRTKVDVSNPSPTNAPMLNTIVTPGNDSLNIVLTKYIWPIIKATPDLLPGKKLHLKLENSDMAQNITMSLVNRDGVTFSKVVTVASDDEIVVDPKDMSITPTLLVPAPYPTFLRREYITENYNRPLDLREVEKLQIQVHGVPSDHSQHIAIESVWLQ